MGDGDDLHAGAVGADVNHHRRVVTQARTSSASPACPACRALAPLRESVPTTRMRDGASFEGNQGYSRLRSLSFA